MAAGARKMPLTGAYSPAYDVALKIQADVFAACGQNLTLNTDLFFDVPYRAPGRGVPQRAVFCVQSAGPGPQSFLDGNTGVCMRYPSVVVFVRSAPHDFTNGQNLTRGVYDTLHMRLFNNYISCRMRQSEAFYLDQEANGSFLWSMDCDLMIVA